MIFVASPYGNLDLFIVEQRVATITKYCGELLEKGESCISAVAFGHPIIKMNNNVRVDWKGWENLCKTLLAASTELHVLMVDGWESSVGVKEEIKLAKSLGIKITYIEIK